MKQHENMNGIKGLLTLEGFWTEEIRYHRRDNENHSSVETVVLSPNLEVCVVNNPDNYHMANLVISVDFPEEDNPLLPFYLFASIRGFFVVDDECDEDTCKKLLNTNAVAVLFPYLRSLVSDITVKGGVPPIILPTINTINLAKKKLGSINQ